MVKLVSRITLDSSSSAAYRQHVFSPACPISAAAVVVLEVLICVRVARDGRGVMPGPGSGSPLGRAPPHTWRQISSAGRGRDSALGSLALCGRHLSGVGGVQC